MGSMLRPPSLGPIVGHTTSSSTRLWIRGAEHGHAGRTIGVAALYKDGEYVEDSARCFRLHREYDRTGTVDFKNLKPNQEYTARLASLSLDDTDSMQFMDDGDIFDKLPDPKVFRGDLLLLPAERSEAIFHTYPPNSDTPDNLEFIFGSCRDPGWTQIGEKRADAIFHHIHQQFDQPNGSLRPDFFMMVGDQIYADLLTRLIPIGKADTSEEFRERYLGAFGAKHLGKLLRHVPTYMILDDHEIEDNWVQGRMKMGAKRSLFHQAIQFYRSYQWIHGPRNFGDRLYYSFECRGYPFFVLDERTQRIRDDDDQKLDDNHMLGYPARNSDSIYKGQIDLLCDWLIEQNNRIEERPKFIVSASVFVPNTVQSANPKKTWKSDSWPAFPLTRSRLLKTIVENDIQNVVFLGGDIHCSNTCEMRFYTDDGNDSGLSAYSIVSSAFYWPYPFADGDPLEFIHDSHAENDDFHIEGTNVTMRYKARSFYQDDNYTKVTVGRETISVQNYNRKGGLLGDEAKLVLGRSE